MSNVINVDKFKNSSASHRSKRNELIYLQSKQIHFNKLCKIASRLDDPELYRLAVNYKTIHIEGGDPVLSPIENILKEIRDRDGAA